MDAFLIQGNGPLRGRLRVNGSKNAALPQMAAVLLTDDPVTLRGLPDLADLRSMVALLDELGCIREDEPSAPGAFGPILTLRAEPGGDPHARYDIVRTMRAGICVLGPLVARRGVARVAMPGGCAIGDRPVDLHLRGLEALGAVITLEEGDIVARAPKGGLRGATLFLGGASGPTVLGTANVMCAATLARGTTIIESAACEPEIVDLARMLNAMGAKVRGAGSPRITVEGVERLGGVEHEVMPDRIEAGTFMVAAAITRGEIELENCPLDCLMAATEQLRLSGVEVESDAEGDGWRSTCQVRMARRPKPMQVTTHPHPGFPTDLQAQFMALACVADGNSIITERIFAERFMHVPELGRMGARLSRQGPTVVATGIERLRGAPVMASDLRASAGLVLAGLAAEGETLVRRVYHLDRGYERLEERLAPLGARIKRVEEVK